MNGAELVQEPSYRPDRCGRSFAHEIARLEEQVALSWTVEQHRLEALGVTDGQRVLDVGCGPGLVSARLAEWLPRSTIVALDPNPRMLDLAREHCGVRPAGRRITFHHNQVEATGLPDGSVDVALSRYLFQHLRHPGDAAQEILRVLRPGGRHVIIEVDDGLWGLAEPRSPEMSAWHRLRARTQCERGGDRFRARELPSLLRAAGYVDVRFDAFACHSDVAGLDAFRAQLDPDQFLPLVNEGRMSVEEFGRARVLYERFVGSPGAFVVFVGFVISGEAPS